MKRVIVGGCVFAAMMLSGQASLAQTPSASGMGPAACTALAARRAFTQTFVMTARIVPAANELPQYCEVRGLIWPALGSVIGVVYRLPDGWNRKALALGGGGWMGNTTLEAAREGLGRGYATLQTDAGHTSGSTFDASPWAIGPDGKASKPALKDFSERAIHQMTLRGKDVIKAYYGASAEHAYYQGCSTGGRMGLMEVQRYPKDFDGVIAGAPVYTFQTQTSAQLRSLAFAAPGARLQASHLALINKAVLAACDADDGKADGVLRDPRACHFNPGTLACAAGQAAENCLAPAQVAAVQKVYAGEKTAKGAIASYPLEQGGETGWARFVPATSANDPGSNSGGMHALRGPLLGNADFDMNGFSPETVEIVRSSWLANLYEAKDPDITKFVRRGGKLILWHGFSDPGPSARGTIEYFDAVHAKTKGADAALRLFIAPGVGHCRGGTGPDRIGWLEALENWVEKGQAPEELPATKANSSLAWNVCAWPRLPTGQPDGTYACAVR